MTTQQPADPDVVAIPTRNILNPDGVPLKQGTIMAMYPDGTTEVIPLDQAPEDVQRLAKHVANTVVCTCGQSTCPHPNIREVMRDAEA